MMPYGIAERVATKEIRQMIARPQVGSALKPLARDGVQLFGLAGGDAARRIDQQREATSVPASAIPPSQ